MKNDTKAIEWSDITNNVLGFLGKYILLPLVVLGGIVSLLGNGAIGLLILVGACVLFLLVALVLIVLKPFIIKKHPEKSEDTYKIDITTPYEELSPFQKLAADHCDGDLVEAFIYMTENLDEETQIAYTENLSSKEALACVCAMDKILEREHLKKKFDNALDLEYILANLDMTEEQIMSAEKNPFVPKLWRLLGGLFLACVVFGAIAGFGNRFVQDESIVETIAIISGCGATFFVYKVAMALINSIRFRKAKRILQKDITKE